MAAPAYANDMTTIATGDLNFDAGTWDESTNGGWDTGGAMVDDEDLWYVDTLVNTAEAASSCTAAQYTKDGTGSGTTGPGTIIYVHTAAFTVPTNGIVSIDNYWAAPPALNDYAGTFGTAEAGVSVLIGTTLGNFDVHYVAGADQFPATDGVYATYFVDPTVTPAGTVGTVTTTNAVGIAIAAGAQARGNPIAVQSVRYGRGEVEYTIGDATTPATFAGYATIDNAIADKFNLLQEIEGGYKARGLMSFGTAATAVYFDDLNISIVLANDLKVSSVFNAIEVNNASSVVNWTAIGITALGTVSKGTFNMVANATVAKTSCTFTDMNTFIYQSNATILTSIYRRCGLVTAGGATITSCGFDNSTSASSLTTPTLTGITKNTFISDGSNHAVEITTVGAGSMTWDNTLSGYVAGTSASPITPSSTGNEAIYLNFTSAATFTINVSAGATIPSIRVSVGMTGDVNVVAGSVTLTITATLKDGTPVQSARAYLKASNGTGPFPFEEAVTISRTTTTATVTHTTHGMATNDKVVLAGITDKIEDNGIKTITVTGANTYTFTTTDSGSTAYTGSIKSTFVALSGITDVNGEITTSRIYASAQPVTGWTRKSSSSPFLQEGVLVGTISSTIGYSGTAVMLKDE